jgi:hypothetical protein
MFKCNAEKFSYENLIHHTGLKNVLLLAFHQKANCLFSSSLQEVLQYERSQIAHVFLQTIKNVIQVFMKFCDSKPEVTIRCVVIWLLHSY